MNRLNLFVDLIDKELADVFNIFCFSFFSFILILSFLASSCWPEFFTDILFYFITELEDSQHFVALPSINLRKTQNKKALRNFNV